MEEKPINSVQIPSKNLFFQSLSFFLLFIFLLFISIIGCLFLLWHIIGTHYRNIFGGNFFVIDPTYTLFAVCFIGITIAVYALDFIMDWFFPNAKTFAKNSKKPTPSFVMRKGTKGFLAILTIAIIMTLGCFRTYLHYDDYGVSFRVLFGKERSYPYSDITRITAYKSYGRIRNIYYMLYFKDGKNLNLQIFEGLENAQGRDKIRIIALKSGKLIEAE